MSHPSNCLATWHLTLIVCQTMLCAAACSSGSAEGQEQSTAAGGNAVPATQASDGGARLGLGGNSNAAAGGEVASTSRGGRGSLGGNEGSTSPTLPVGANGGVGTSMPSATSIPLSGTAGRANTTSTGSGGTSAAGGASANSIPRGGTSPSGTTTGGRAALGGSTSNGTAARGGVVVGGAAGAGTHSTGGSGSGAVGSSVAGAGLAGVAGATLSSILEPASGALLGLYYGDASISATSTKLGRTVPLHLTYYAWSDDWTKGETTADLNAGRIPFVCWELFGATLDEIASGNYDTVLGQRAAAAKKLGKKLFVDFGAEMNGNWSPWSGAENGQSSAKYIAAYRHVHDIFVTAGATNVIWAFCPNVTSVPDAAWNEPLDYYPGDSYVDWLCVDGYNWGTSSSGDSWQSFFQVFRDIYPILATKNKPIIIGEMASTELGGDKAKWISEIIPTMKSQFPLLKGLNWFDVNKETDWRISSTAAAEAAFKQMANDPWFVRY